MDKDLIKYFIALTDKRFDKIDKKLDSLLSFKWKVLGAATATSFIVTAAIQLVIAYLKP